MRYFTFFCIWLLAAGAVLAQAETEPNDSQSTANTIAEGATVTGTIGSLGDSYDYFLTVPGNDGTINVQFSFSGGISTSDFYMYALNKNGNNIGSTIRTNISSGSDSLLIYCRQSDTIFLRINSNGFYNWQFSYNSIPSGTADAEPNDVIANAVGFTIADTMKGRIGYTSVATDDYDYYRTVLPDDGTLVYYLEYINTSNSTASDIGSYIYNKNGTAIESNTQVNQPLGMSYDTLYVYGRAADTVYFRISSFGCFSYKFHYELIPSGTRDPEPNDLFVDAVDFTVADTVKGRIGYTSVATDDYDYFRTVLPDDGTLVYYLEYINTSNSTASDIGSYIYNKNGTAIESNTQVNQPLGMSYDTLYVYGRAADTVYFRISSAGSFSYEFHYELIPSGTRDPEPNDLFVDAVDFTVADTVKGRIGYTSVATDDYDYFRTVLPDDGTLVYYLEYINTSNSTGADIGSYIYNKNGGTSIGLNAQNNQPLGQGYDTIRVYCRAADTVYFRISSAGSFSYEFHYEIISSGMPDAEPNDTRATATYFVSDSSVKGRIGHISVATDNFDYFKVLAPQDGSMEIVLDYTNPTPFSSNDLYVYAFNRAGSQIGSRVYVNRPTGSYRDTLAINCLTSDTTWIRISSSGCFSYEFSVKTNEERPQAEIDVIRFGNRASFSSRIKYADNILWDLAGGDQSNLRYPTKDFPIGLHNISFTATNSKCNYSKILRDTLSVEGIEDYQPKSAGTDDGLGFFTVKFFGAGLDTMATIVLKQGGTTITADRMASPATQEVTALFSMKNAPLGMYDIEVTFSSGQQFFIPNGFEIYSEEHAWRVYTRLNGPSRIRTGREVSYALDVVNENGFIANGVRVFVIAPKGVETNLTETMERKSGTFSIKGADWNALSINLQDFEDTYFQGSFDPNIDTVFVNWDSIYSHFDSLASFEITQLYNEPFEGTVYPMYIPFINANSTYTINFKVKSNSNQQFGLISYVWPYSYRKNPINDCTLGFIHDLGLQGAALAELSPHPALRAVGKSAGYVDIGSQVAFTEFFDWYYGVNNADATFYGRQTIALGGNLAGEIAPFKGGKNFDKAVDQANFSRRALKNSTEFKSVLQQTITGGGRISPSMSNRLTKELGYLNDILANQGSNLSKAQKQQAINAARHILEKNGLNFGTSEIQDMLFPEKTPSKVNEPDEKEEKARPFTNLL